MINYNTCFVACIVLLTPAAVLAQRPGGMGGGGGFGGPGERGAMRPGGAEPALPSSKSILKDSPLRLLLDKKKDLSLTDSQTVKLVNRQVELDQALAPALAQLDSAAKVSRPARGNPDDMTNEERERMMERGSALRALVQTIRVKEDSVATLVVAELSQQQQPKAKELLQERRGKMEKKESSQERGMRGGRGGGGRGGGRPGMRPPNALR